MRWPSCRARPEAWVIDPKCSAAVHWKTKRQEHPKRHSDLSAALCSFFLSLSHTLCSSHSGEAGTQREVKTAITTDQLQRFFNDTNEKSRGWMREELRLNATLGFFTNACVDSMLELFGSLLFLLQVWYFTHIWTSEDDQKHQQNACHTKNQVLLYILLLSYWDIFIFPGTAWRQECAKWQRLKSSNEVFKFIVFYLYILYITHMMHILKKKIKINSKVFQSCQNAFNLILSENSTFILCVYNVYMNSVCMCVYIYIYIWRASILKCY